MVLGGEEGWESWDVIESEGWAGLGWAELGWAGLWAPGAEDQVLPVPSVQTETSKLAEVHGCCSIPAPVQHFLCLYNS